MFKIMAWVARALFVPVRRPMCVTLVLIAALPLTAYVAWKAGGGGRPPAPAFGPVVFSHALGEPTVVRVYRDQDRGHTVMRVLGEHGEGMFFTKDGPIGSSGKVLFGTDVRPPAHGDGSR